jgi:biopolymer transport protein ExbD
MKRNLYKIIFSTLSCLSVFSCAEKQNSNEILENQAGKEKVIVVKIPPFYDNKLSREENFWRFDNFLFPRENISGLPPKEIPNYDALLNVRVDKNGNLKLNASEQGNLADTSQLKKTLTQVFREREENKVYEPASDKIVKAVGIQAEDSVKYAELFRVIEAVKESRADPIVLRFEGDVLTQVFKIEK